MVRRWLRWWTPVRVIDAVAVLAVIYVTVWSLHPSLVFSSTLITGGDTGAHVALPAYLRTQGDLFNLTPWYPGWFAGMPAYTYYFVLPDVLATLLSYVIGFAVAFKLATILGSVLLPITAYSLGKLFRAPRPIPAALAVATLPFLFDASFTIDGGNLFSTMAGEYAFSLSLALSLLTIGLFARGVRTGRGYWWAALALSATSASHLLPWMFTIVAVGVLVVFELLQRRGIGDPNDLDMVPGDYARPLRFAAGAGLLSLALSAWWLAPFATTQNLTNSMGYTNQPVNSIYQIFAQLGWNFRNPTTGAITAGGDRWVIVLAALALVVAFIVRDRLGMVLATLMVLSLCAYVVDPQSALWNERFVPFWFITIHLLAGWLFGYALSRWVRRTRRPRLEVDYVEGDRIGYEFDDVDPASDDADADDADDTEPALHEVDVEAAPFELYDQLEFIENREAEDRRRTSRRTVRATAAVALLGLLSTVPGLIPPAAKFLHLNTTGNEVTNWAAYNYSGYQALPAWPEYHDIMQTMTRVAHRYGCGRAMWEYNANEGRFGTPEALMLLPYWTNNCVDSMEGLFFESSSTAAFHFLDQAELSAAPSNPEVGLPYGGLDVFAGVRHLQLLGVKYYMAFSPSVIAEANLDPQLRLVATTRHWPAPGATWRIYLIRNSPMVQPLTSLPNVVAGISSRVAWLTANTSWYLSAKAGEVFAAESGPSTWPHVASIGGVKATTTLPSVTVTHVTVATQSISFHVSRTGVPVLVKISYFPRWHAQGAAGPYRVSPNLMVVVPTQKDVTMTYGSSPALEWGNVVSDAATVAGLIVLWFAVKRRRLTRK